MIPQHLSQSNEHYTPDQIVIPARRVLGQIDLDPASSAAANERVQAETFFSIAEDGLSKDWFGNVFLNPPGGRVLPKKNHYGMRSSAAVWWAKLADEYTAGRVKQAIFVGFSIEIMRTAQKHPTLQPLDFSFCVPSRRIAFITPLGKAGKSPTNANVIVYMGENKDEFFEEFRHLGRVVLL